ncbi:hypothetical protein TSTA_026810 [Talaromyces stipitatus ATCC 10500]|uniref:Uncharacterized protein n=1 Tax=Talaromyces stipitatus (strain ATCC 10500 / CBS 375.48 / QM 6759 / NRRL 1006) TaxID=441959 RepID=B8M4U0_TALSN|nr:uncharacterized protein TSTA_026810 [Talaromyces stipitatus ATCC 10500]EED19375.1 hypothetical protein TSTA_026810 [Talaromyces stipitatus ATCC 10500]
MSQSRTIKDYFKRPAFAQDNKLPTNASTPAFSQPSPLSDPPSDLPSHFPSSQHLPDPIVEPQAKGSARSPNRTVPSYNGGYTSFQPSSSLNANFNSPQRIVKNGKEIVIDSDADDASSDEFLEADELLKKFLGTASSPSRKNATDSHNARPTSPSKLSNRKRNDARNFRAKLKLEEKKYRFSMASLVTSAVDDDEVETKVLNAKALLDSQNETTSALAETKSGALREDILASALSAKNEEVDFQRLVNAVKRTEALEQEKSWRFFSDDSKKQDLPEFPRDSILPSSREAFLRESFTRERAFFSGIIDFSLSRNVLPDEVLIWIFQSVSLEPRAELRYAYCRAIKSTKRERIESLIGPEDIDQIFFSLGGHSTAVNASEIIPEILFNQGETSRNWGFLLSVLQMLRDIADCLRADTKEHTLYVLFRLTLDTTISYNDMVIASLEATMDYLLQSIPQENFGNLVQPIARTLFRTVKDVTFQSKLLNHILPSIRQIAILRCRLAMAFLTKDESCLDDLNEQIIPLSRIIDHLRATRLDAQLHKARLDSDYDYTEIKAITTLLNIVIDTGRTIQVFPDKEAERQFNADVDSLAEQVKRIFSAMEDSGASHLKRTEAKQSLEALQYRIIYSIRTKRRIKSMFGHNSPMKIRKYFDAQQPRKDRPDE